jgi:molybdopterin/thiamine biosynthesis adenylyltransferase/rhodanese-related sulfurtransferase
MKPAGDVSNEVSVTEAARAACPARPILDIRTPDERRLGGPAGAVVLTPQALLDICRKDPAFARRGGDVLCAEGVRSLAVVERLRAAGFEGFRSVRGGMNAWLAAGLPRVGDPDFDGAGFDGAEAERYARHLVLPEVGPVGQRRLSKARVLLAGLGGLGSPAGLYLAAAGVGTLGLLDDDRVARSNLQRQILYADDAVGARKTRAAANRLQAANPGVRTEVIEQRVTAENAARCVQGWDLVIDGTDNFAARYALNDACLGAGIPLVYGAVMRFQGQVSVFWPAGGADAPCFRCLLPEPPDRDATPSCAEAGVLGVLPGIIGTLQATEALKILLGIGQPLLGRLLLVDALATEFRTMRLPRRPGCPACA